MWYWYTQWQ